MLINFTWNLDSFGVFYLRHSSGKLFERIATKMREGKNWQQKLLKTDMFGPCHMTRRCEFDGFYTTCCCSSKGESTGLCGCRLAASVWLCDHNVGLWRRICLRWIIRNTRVESFEVVSDTAQHDKAASPASTFRPTPIRNLCWERGIRHSLEGMCWCMVGISGMLASGDTTTDRWHVLAENWSESTLLSSQLMCFVLFIKHLLFLVYS